MQSRSSSFALLLSVFVCTLAVLAVRPNTAAADGEEQILAEIDRHRVATWRWQRLMGRPLTPTDHGERQVESLAYREWVLRLWKGRAARAQKRAKRPPHLKDWRCIQRHEGPWNANTGNGYYGGLQMDIRFQRRYGRFLLRRKGRAHGWTPLEQIWIAERARRSGRGFYPWPVAASRCGLL